MVHGLLIGNVGHTGVFGLGYQGGRLFGFTQAGTVIEIDQRTGAVVRSFNSLFIWNGATTNPVRWN
jgi:hypothetical protein